MQDTIVNWTQGHTYVIDLVIPPRRKPRRSCMTFLGANQWTGELQFNARPAAGTQGIRQEWVVAVEDLGPSKGRDDERHYVDRPVR